MTTHQFGGEWTTDKLERLRKYLQAYTTIFTKNVRAQYYRTIYVDAFAGTGTRMHSKPASSEAPLFPELAEADAQAYQ